MSLYITILHSFCIGNSEAESDPSTSEARQGERPLSTSEVKRDPPTSEAERDPSLLVRQREDSSLPVRPRETSLPMTQRETPLYQCGSGRVSTSEAEKDPSTSEAERHPSLPVSEVEIDPSTSVESDPSTIEADSDLITSEAESDPSTSDGSNYVCPSCFHLLRRRCFAPDGFDAVSVQNVGSTYIIVSWDLPTHSNGILINFSLYCNGALAGVLPLTVISYNTTCLLPFTLYMYMSSSHARRHCTPVGTWCWASSVLQPACPDLIWSYLGTLPQDPMCILLQLISLLVEHTAPNIHEANKYCSLCWPWGLTATTKPTRAVQGVHNHCPG
ncbi:hypothetical protein EMCRGX_G029148 [Ephydatia muelleri]